jgi:hypothetical protein
MLPALASLARPFGGALGGENAQAASDGGEEVPSAPAATDGGLGEAIAAPDGGAAHLPLVATSRRSPSFTQDRQFTNARLWLLDEGQYTVEQWWTGTWGTPRLLAGTNNQDDQLLQTEIELGLMPHLEFDLYANFDLSPDDSGNYQFSPTGRTGLAAELRVAIGSHWGQIWGNPVLDAELWGQVNEPTRLEGRVALGGAVLTPKLLGAVNFMFARNAIHDDATGLNYEIKAFPGLSYEVIPDILRLGAEATIGWDSHNTVDAANNTVQFFTAQVGPEIVLTAPRNRFKLVAAVLYGLAYWDPPWQSQVIAGTTF